MVVVALVLDGDALDGDALVTHGLRTLVVLDIFLGHARGWPHGAARRRVRLNLLQQRIDGSGGLAPARRPRIDLGAEQEDDGEIVEKYEDHHGEACRRAEVLRVEEVRNVEREQRLIQHQEHRRDERALPHLAQAHWPIGHHDIDGGEQHRGEQHRQQIETCLNQEAEHRGILADSQCAHHGRRNDGSEQHDRNQHRVEQDHADRHQVLT